VLLNFPQTYSGWHQIYANTNANPTSEPFATTSLHAIIINPKYLVMARVNVLRDMILSREAKNQCFLTCDEIQTIIHAVCTEYLMFFYFSLFV